MIIIHYDSVIKKCNFSLEYCACVLSINLIERVKISTAIVVIKAKSLSASWREASESTMSSTSAAQKVSDYFKGRIDLSLLDCRR